MRALILTLAVTLALTTPAAAQFVRITPQGPLGPVETYRPPRSVPPSAWVPAPPVRPYAPPPTLLESAPRPLLGTSVPPPMYHRSLYEDARQLRCAQWPGLAVCR